MKWIPRRLVVVSLAAIAAACSGQPDGPSGSGGGAPSVGSSLATEVFSGAGDIGRCGSAGPEATALLLDRQPGTVTLETTPTRAVERTTDCYAPSWGRHCSRTKRGHHDEQPGALPTHTSDRVPGWMIATRSHLARGASSRSTAKCPHGWLAAGCVGFERTGLDAICVRPPTGTGRWSVRRPRRQPGHGRSLRLRDAGAELRPSGHDHNYERSDRLDPIAGSAAASSSWNGRHRVVLPAA
jgi:hypothetical protein